MWVYIDSDCKMTSDPGPKDQLLRWHFSAYQVQLLLVAPKDYFALGPICSEQYSKVRERVAGGSLCFGTSRMLNSFRNRFDGGQT